MSMTNPSSDIKFYYRTSDMHKPTLFWSEHEAFPNENVVQVSFVPTFEECSDFKIEYDEPTISERLSAEDLLFIFILDRSGSMGGPRMTTANGAVTSFIHSLPTGCSFSLICFGDEIEVQENLDIQRGPVFKYNDKSKKAVCERIARFQADMGGTNIIDPLNFAINNLPAKSPEGKTYRKRVFLLTDGQVPNADAIVEVTQKASDFCHVSTFGIGQECDKELCESMAFEGNGTYCFVDDDDIEALNSKVIKSLKYASDLALEKCEMQWNDEEAEHLGTVFRNELIHKTILVNNSETQLKTLKFTFKVGKDQLTNEAWQIEFNRDQFKKSSTIPSASLFKFAALELINSIKDHDARVMLSTTYQVLCDDTAMIGVVHNEKSEVSRN